MYQTERLRDESLLLRLFFRLLRDRFSRSFGRPSQVTVRRMLRDRCPVCLSYPRVTLGYCGQTVEWIKMTLGTDVGLGPGDIVLDGNPAPPTERGTAAPTFRPVSFVAKRSPISATAELL